MDESNSVVALELLSKDGESKWTELLSILEKKFYFNSIVFLKDYVSINFIFL